MQLRHPDRFQARPQAVLFDLDNTLYPYDPAHEAAWRAVVDKLSGAFSITPRRCEQAFREARDQVKAQLGRTASSHSRLLYFQRMLEIEGLGSRLLSVLDLEQTYWRTFLRNAVPFDGVRELLDDLRLSDIPVALVTDLTAQIQFRKLVYWRLDNDFDSVVTSEEAGADKPHEAPFRLVREKVRAAGDVLWMIGDDPEADIRGARDAIGAVTLQKVHPGVRKGRDDTAPDAWFGDFQELRGFMRRQGFLAGGAAGAARAGAEAGVGAGAGAETGAQAQAGAGAR